MTTEDIWLDMVLMQHLS